MYFETGQGPIMKGWQARFGPHAAIREPLSQPSTSAFGQQK